MGLSIGTSSRSFIFQDVVRAITQTQEVVNVHLAPLEHTISDSNLNHVDHVQKDTPPYRKKANGEYNVYLVREIHFMSGGDL